MEKVWENENEEKAFVTLAIFLNVDFKNTMQVVYLIRAIKYADVLDFYPHPKSLEDSISNEIFTTKAVSYYRREMLNQITDKKEIYEIWRQEHYIVSRKRSQLSPKIY